MWRTFRDLYAHEHKNILDSSEWEWHWIWEWKKKQMIKEGTEEINGFMRNRSESWNTWIKIDNNSDKKKYKKPRGMLNDRPKKKPERKKKKREIDNKQQEDQNGKNIGFWAWGMSNCLRHWYILSCQPPKLNYAVENGIKYECTTYQRPKPETYFSQYAPTAQHKYTHRSIETSTK